MSNATQVKKLREESGLSIMLCKKALEEAGGDLDQAIAFLKKEAAGLGKLSDTELQKKSGDAKKEREKTETKRDEMTKNKYWVT